MKQRTVKPSFRKLETLVGLFRAGDMGWAVRPVVRTISVSSDFLFRLSPGWHVRLEPPHFNRLTSCLFQSPFLEPGTSSPLCDCEYVAHFGMVSPLYFDDILTEY